MKTMVVLLNVVFLAFTCLVMLTDGFAAEPAYAVFSLLLIGVPIFTLTTIGRSVGGGIRRATALFNFVLVGFIVWALVDQYPHPSEPGYVPYAALTVLTPLLTAAFLVLGGPRSTRQPAQPASIS